MKDHVNTSTVSSSRQKLYHKFIGKINFHIFKTWREKIEFNAVLLARSDTHFISGSEDHWSFKLSDPKCGNSVMARQFNRKRLGQQSVCIYPINNTIIVLQFNKCLLVMHEVSSCEPFYINVQCLNLTKVKTACKTMIMHNLIRYLRNACV